MDVDKHKSVSDSKMASCMRNACQRVTYHATCTNRENISISHQTLAYAARGMVTVHFLPDEQVDITISKNQALQILYIAYSTVLQC